MAKLLKSMVNGYTYAVKDLADTRTSDWFLVQSPVPIVFIILGYLFVVEIGPKYMKNRKPIDLKNTLIVYNIAQILICSFVTITAFQQLFISIRKSRTILCQEIDYSYESMAVCYLAYRYFCTKIFDLLDTVFFILRKKSNQVTFLHVYHHAMMVSYTWYGVKYVAGGQLIFIGFINSLVHVVMYSYYLLTAFDSSYKQSVWWKKHLTQLQLAQFIMITLWLIMPFFDSACNFSRALTLVLLPQVLAVTVLFADFYYKLYIRKKPAKISK